VKIKLDENLPVALARRLEGLGHQVDTVLDEGLRGVDDDRVWEAAQGEGRFLITQDLDFSDIRKFAPGTHHGLMLVRLRDPGRLALIEFVSEVFASYDVGDWQECFLVATERKLRIIRSEP
jgi:predicted nuclease of predicted toxin-antitoxin system